jgi:hypothetical protein
MFSFHMEKTFHFLNNYFLKKNVIHGYLLLPRDTSIYVDYLFGVGGYLHGYGMDTNIIFVQRGRHKYHTICIHGYHRHAWLWRHDSCGSYFVRGAYKVLTDVGFHGVEASSDLIWHKQVSLNVFVLAWRLLRNRLPTKDNLTTRNIIYHDSQVCMTGCGGFETS